MDAKQDQLLLHLFKAEILMDLKHFITAVDLSVQISIIRPFCLEFDSTLAIPLRQFKLLLLNIKDLLGYAR